MAAAVEAGHQRHEAARDLYERFHASVYRYALSQVRSPEDAEDATQNTFLRAFAALQRGVVPENEAAWLFKIAHNVCVSSKLAWLRRRRVETPRDLDDLPVAAVAPDARRDELHGLDDALAAMPPRLREAFLLREWQGLSYQEIADRLDTSRSAVETLIFRARRTLAAQLEAPARKVRNALGVGQLLAALRGFAGGGAVAVKAAAVAAVVAGAGVALQPLLHHAPPAPRPAVAPVRTHHVVPAATRVAPARPVRTVARAPRTAKPTPAAASTAPAPAPADATPGTAAPAAQPSTPAPPVVSVPATTPTPAANPAVAAPSVPSGTPTVPPPPLTPPALPALPALPLPAPPGAAAPTVPVTVPQTPLP